MRNIFSDFEFLKRALSGEKPETSDKFYSELSQNERKVRDKL